MDCRKGTMLAANCSNRRSIPARGFFNLFYQWSRVGYEVSNKHSARCVHANNASRRPTQIPACQRTSYYLTTRARALPQIRHESSSARSNTPNLGEPPLSTSLRTLMRCLPHSVVVLTTSISRPVIPATSTDHETHFRGMTLSSFTTLTLTPSPIITFNIRQPSHTLDAIAESKQFLIHVLDESEDGARLAGCFTKGNGKGGEDVFRSLDIETSFDPDMKVLLPAINNEGVLKVLRCQVLDEGEDRKGLVRVGDHVLVLAKVHEILPGDLRNKGGKESHGLCYADGTYKRIGDVIEVKKKAKAR